MAFNPNPSSLPLIKEDRTQILNATLSFLSTNPSIKTHSLHGNLLANLLNASPVDFPMNASDNKPPALTPWFSSFKKPDPLTDRQNGTENNQIKPLQVTLGLNNMLLPISKNSISPAEESFIRVKEDYIKLQDVDFWLVFEKKQVTMKVENFLEDLKNQFESINIVKIKQFYFLDKRNSDLLVTGWKLFDETLVYDIINQTKKLLLTSSNQKLDFQIIQSATDLRRHLRKVVLDKKLELLDLFNEQFAKPLFKLQVQGLVYYEFDYVDLCPETLCILCGLPPSTTDAELLDCFTHHVLPKPMNILRNPTSEGQTTVRVSFAERSAADLLRFQGLKVPVAGEFHFKPLILIPIKSRNFDYLTELVKFQVKIDFEIKEKLDRQTLVKYMKELELRYGSISDVNMIEEACCIVSFTQISSAGKCLDSAKFEEFSLKAVMSKLKKAYPCSGYLFQSELENARNDFVIQRPPPLVKADPAQFKIPSKFFEKKLNLKKRYQKIYLTQQRESSRRKESKDLEKVEENSPSISDFKYEQILTEGVVNHEQDHSHSTKNSKAEEISSNLIQTTEKTAKELIAEISKPSSINTKRPPLSPSVDSEVENDDVPEPEIEPEEDESFEDFHIKILQPITDELELQNHQAKMEEHDQSTEVEQNDSKLIAKASKPTKKLKTESRVSPKIKLENKLRNNPKTKGGASIRTGKYLKKAVEDQGTPKRSERLALKADKGGSKIYASLLKSYNKKKKEIKQKRKALAKTKKRAQKRGPIEDNLYTRESPLINFMMNNFVKNEEQHEEEEEINIKNEDIRNIKIEVKKELIEEEFGFRVEIEVPDMKALFLPRELRQVKMVSSRYLMKKPTHSKQFKPYKPYKQPRVAEIEDKTKLLIQQNIEKIRNLIEINEDIRRKKQADDKETKVKVEEF